MFLYIKTMIFSLVRSSVDSNLPIDFEDKVVWITF